MKCPKCGAASSVLDTRVYKTVMLVRRRQCFNECRTFKTYEVFAGNLDKSTLNTTASGHAKRVQAHSRKQTVLRQPNKTPRQLAEELGISEDRARKIRRGVR